MLKRKNKQPKLLTPKQFNDISQIEELKTTGLNNWTEVLGDNWEIASEEEHYAQYVNWYQKTFTKLGKYLND
jgi:hypothetical protein